MKIANLRNLLLKQSLLVTILIALTVDIYAQNINIPNNNGPLGTEVNTLTGNLFLSRTDAYVPAREIDLDMTFYYNSFNFNQNLDFGNGWSFNYSMFYSVDSVGDITITMGDARQEVYTFNSGSFTPSTGIFDSLSQYQSGKYLLTSKYGMQYYFDNNIVKRLTKIQSPNSNFLSFSYTDTLLTSITNGAGQTITLNYTSGLLSSMVDAIATPTRTYTYQYDGYGNLIQVTDPLGGKFKYQYLINGPMSKITDKNSNAADIIYYPDFTVSELIACDSRKSFSYDSTSLVSTVTDYVPTNENQTTSYYYKKYNNLFWLTKITGNCCGYIKSFSFDAKGNVVSSTDANGNVYSYTYDNKGNVLTQTDPLGNINTYSYSPDFNQITGYTDAKGNSYTYSYDNKGNALQFTEPGNLVITNTYSSLGDIISATTPNGEVFHFVYDANGYPIQLVGPKNFSVKHVLDNLGNILSVTDPNNNIYTSTYDLLNRITSVTDPLNNSLSINYDNNNNVKSIKNRNGNTNTFSYDASDRLVQTNDPLGKQTLYAYDAKNNLIKYTDRNGNSTSFNYDNLNRLISAVDPLGDYYNFNYDANGNMILSVFPNGDTIFNVFDKLDRTISSSDTYGSLGSFIFDKNGNITSFTNAIGATTTASYDPLNRLISLTDPLGNSTSFSYDKNSQIISTTDRNNHTSGFSYDSLGQEISYTDPNGFVTNARYDDAVNLILLTDQNNHSSSFSYDALNRLITEHYPNSSSTNYTYDNVGNVLSKQLTDGSFINYQYDADNRLLTKSLPGNTFNYNYDSEGKITRAANATGTITLNYDNLNRISSESFNGHTTGYTYSIPARTSQILYPDGSSIIYNYDSRDRLVSIFKGNSIIASYQYNLVNDLQQIGFGNGVISNWQYDATNRLSAIYTSNGNIQNSSFTYDNEMNKTSVTKSNIPQASEQYNYDAGYRLTSFAQGLLQNNYTYDAVGNRISANLNGVSTSYNGNNLNQITNLNNGSQNINFTYDNNGNLTFDGTYYKTYDAEGHLQSDSSAINKVKYNYDAFGRRFQEIINGHAIYYYYAGLQQLEQRDAISDTILNETIYRDLLSPVMLFSGKKKYFYHQNDINSIEAITDSIGNLVERYQYDSYGKPSIYGSSNNPLTSSLIGNRFAFTGHEYDTTTASYHFHFRNYSPVTGNFYQRDPIDYDDGTAQYQYVHNNPVNSIDILGLEDCDKSEKGHSKEAEAEWWKEYFEAIHHGVHFRAEQVEANIKYLEGIIEHTTDVKDQYFVLSQLKAQYQTLSSPNAMELTNLKSISDEMSVMEQNADLISGTSKTFGALEGLGKALNVVGTGIETGVAIKTLANSDKTNADKIEAVEDAAKTGLNYNPVTAMGNVVDWAGGKIMNMYTGEESKGILDFTAKQLAEKEKLKNEMEDIDQEMEIFKNFEGNPDKVANWAASTLRMKEREEEYERSKKEKCPIDKHHGTEKKTPPGPGNPGSSWWTNVLGPHDPNLIVGPIGVGTPKWVSINAKMPYTIYYENSGAASAPAKVVRVNYPINPKQDLSNFSLGGFGFNNLTFNIPPNTASYYQRLDVRDSLGLYVDLTAGLDVINNQIFWTFESIDPTTLLPPTDPNIGFLLLSDSSNSTYGHGFVNFNIKPKPTDITGDTTHATAFIVFDLNDTIPTNVAKNTIDAIAPTSQINSLSATSNTATIPLSWSGKDDPNGSGIQSYTLYVSSNGGSYTILGQGMTSTDTTFTGANNSTYSFFVLATDSAGNTEVLRPGAETSVFIQVQSVLPITMINFTVTNQGDDDYLAWETPSEINIKDYEIERSLDGINFTKIATINAIGNSQNKTDYNYIDTNVTALNVPVIYYRIKQISMNGNSNFSNIEVIHSRITGPFVKVYPNPFKQFLNLMISNIEAVNKDDNAMLYTIEGKLIYQHQLCDRIPSQFITLSDLPKLAAGSYILKLTLNHQQYSFTIIKNN